MQTWKVLIGNCSSVSSISLSSISQFLIEGADRLVNSYVLRVSCFNDDAQSLKRKPEYDLVAQGIS